MKKKRVVVVLMLICLATQLFSIDLDEIVRRAKEQSSTMRLIELNKKSSDLTLAAKDLKGKVGVGVESGQITFSETNYKEGLPPLDNYLYTMTGAPKVSVKLPNDGNTSLDFTIPFATTLSEEWIWNVAPTIGAQHSFKFGDVGETLDDLKTTRQRLEFDLSYNNRLLDFENSIYSKIYEIIGYQISLLKGEKDILIAQTKLDNALKLKTVSEGSTAHLNMVLTLTQLQNVKKGTLDKIALAKGQYKQLTGLEWAEIEPIKEVDIKFSALPGGDTTVWLTALDEEIAKEELALNQRLQGESKSVPTLIVGGSAGFTHSQGLGPDATSYSINPSASYIGKNFTVGGSLKLNIDGNDGKVTPVVSISGGWQNNVASAREALTLQSLEQSVAIAGLSRQEALLSYQIKANQLEADILSFNLNKEQFESNNRYKQQVLEKTQEAYERGLVTQTDVDAARLDVELVKYEEQRNALEALMLANRAKALEL